MIEGTRASRNPELTAREIEVVQALAEGLTNKEIGKKLYITINTVKLHLRNIGDRFDIPPGPKGSHSVLRTKILREAYNRGYIR